jgi:hypothetical protein
VAWMCVCTCFCVVLSCVSVEALCWTDPPDPPNFLSNGYQGLFPLG